MDNTGNGSAAIVSWVRRTMKGHPLVMSTDANGAAGRVELIPFDPGGRFPAVGISITNLPVMRVVEQEALWEVALVQVMAVDVNVPDFTKTIELAKIIKNWLQNGKGAINMTVTEGYIQRFMLEGPPLMYKRRNQELDRMEYYNGYQFRCEVR